jgi:abortive infection bacteriophage resistance protein
MLNKGKKLKEAELISKTIDQFSNKPQRTEVKKYLENITYFDLVKGYKGTLLKNADNNFISGLGIDSLYQIHWLDITLNDLLLKYTLETEKHLKSQLISVVSDYGDKPSQYLDKVKYSIRGNASVLYKIENDISADVDGYFREFKDRNETNDIPAWFLIQHLSLGRCINLYSVLNSFHKLKIATSFLESMPYKKINDEAKKRLVKTFLDFTLEVRNKAAHGNRLLNIDFQEDINGQSALLRKLELIEYFKISKNEVITSDISNFIIATLVLNNIPLFAINMVQEFTLFFSNNSAEENNMLQGLKINAYDLFKVDEDDLHRIEQFLNAQYGKKH